MIFFFKLTSVFKVWEGERIVCQRFKEIRDVAPVPQGFVCGHDGRATKRRDEPDTVSIYRLFVSSVTFEQLRIRSHHEDAYMCQNNLD